jgi:hypothetical protein
MKAYRQNEGMASLILNDGTRRAGLDVSEESSLYMQGLYLNSQPLFVTSRMYFFARSDCRMSGLA